jgi:murein DD-endopeptidase MepM/ murein hydrolase activator NlpD
VQDPLAELAYDWSPYRYGYNNPTRYIDPNGLIEWPVDATYNGHKRRHENNFRNPRLNHQGVDINLGAGNDDLGASVYATHDGTITRIASIADGDTGAGGNRIQITSECGEVSTFYMHLDALSDGLEVGGAIAEGQQIGTLGGSGFGNSDSYDAHLHYELRVGGELVNPTRSPDNLKDPQSIINHRSGTNPPRVVDSSQSNTSSAWQQKLTEYFTIINPNR